MTEVTLKKVMKEDRELLWNINQKYLYEMARFAAFRIQGDTD